MATMRKSAENRKNLVSQKITCSWDLMKSYWMISSSEKWHCALGEVRVLDVCVLSKFPKIELYSLYLQPVPFCNINICTPEQGGRNECHFIRPFLKMNSG